MTRAMKYSAAYYEGEAEHCLKAMEGFEPSDTFGQTITMAFAQVYATLAVAAATKEAAKQ